MKDGSVPNVGDWVYLCPSYYIDPFNTDVLGGLAQVTEVTERISAGKPTPFITTAQVPATSYNWEWLAREQDELRERFGDTICTTEPS